MISIKFRIDAPAVDQDADGVFDWIDNCPTVANPDQQDSVHNGVGDACRCLTVSCTPSDACHSAGACQPTTGSCTNPAVADGTARAIANATASCRSGTCALGTCNGGWADCNHSLADGCETATTTIANCGACGVACIAGPNSTAVCSGGACGLSCASGWANCDGRAQTGCEQSIVAAAANCGACGVRCGIDQVCSAGACTNLVCQAGTGDCDHVGANGCEVNTVTDTANCGSCGTACAFANAAASCASSTCVMGACAAGFADCDHVAADGCEIDTRISASNCGACGVVCSFANAAASCAGGACAMGACNAGLADCNGSAADGCETDLGASLANCGACGRACVVPNANPACSSGACGIASCKAGFADCNGGAADGCEINVGGDASNCGRCGTVCTAGPNSTPLCTGGGCAIACDNGFANCDGQSANGCEVNIQSDAANCGTCGTGCAAHETCQSGACSATICDAGWADCDHLAANGCEAPLGSDIANCGTCGNACSYANATATCISGVCGFSVCTTGFGDCDGALANGCEATLATDIANCGACRAACAPPNSVGACQSGACTLVNCNRGWADCDGNIANGCEVNVASDVTNCGQCRLVCTLANATAACQGGACAVGSCTSGFADCDGNAQSGCEVDTTRDVNNCGACRSACAVPNATSSCTGGVCGVAACNAGFADCDGSAANGCEVNTTADLNNCGACGTACAAASGVAACVSGACGVGSCNSGYANCDGQYATGCETNTASDLSNCGGCGVTCTFPNGAPRCEHGACGGTQCNSGYADCDGNPNTGCEVATATDTNNCGACGSRCSVANGTAGCAGGACTVASCAAPYANCDNLVANGCEANTSSDVFNCNGCGTHCTAPNANTACSNSACVIASCQSTSGDCNHSYGDGCEIGLSSDVNNCGACGHACSSNGGIALCTGGSCSITCNANFGNCDGNLNNGCEANLLTDNNNCGTCGNACNGICAGGACNQITLQPSSQVLGMQGSCSLATYTSYMIIGRAALGCYGFDGMVQFDLAPLRAAGITTIKSAKLGLLREGWYSSGPWNAFPTSVYPVLGPWNTGYNWNNAPAFDITSYGTGLNNAVSVTGASGWLEWDVTPDVQAWLSGARTNCGLRVSAGNPANWSNDNVMYFGGDAVPVGERPRLVVQY